MKADCYTDDKGCEYSPGQRVQIITFSGSALEGEIDKVTSGAILLRECCVDCGTSGATLTNARVPYSDIEFIRCLTTEKTQVKVEMVDHPNHYQSETGLEVIDVIEAFTFDLKGTEAFDTGNIIKYICRWKQKNGLEDLRKAQWYLEHLINHVDNLEKENGKS